MRRAQRQSGYTLLEVVIAFSILVIALAAVAESVRLSVRRIDRTRNRTQALLLADSILERLGKDIPLAQGKQSKAQDGCNWRIESTPSDSVSLTQTAVLQGYDVKIDVGCGEAEALQTAHLDVFELGVAGS